MGEWELVGQDDRFWKFAQRGGYLEVTIEKASGLSMQSPLPRIRNSNRVFVPSDDRGWNWEEWELNHSPFRLRMGVSEYEVK